jgi:hypothetical protein
MSAALQLRRGPLQPRGQGGELVSAAEALAALREAHEEVSSEVDERASEHDSALDEARELAGELRSELDDSRKQVRDVVAAIRVAYEGDTVKVEAAEDQLTELEGSSKIGT